MSRFSGKVSFLKLFLQLVPSYIVSRIDTLVLRILSV